MAGHLRLMMEIISTMNFATVIIVAKQSNQQGVVMNPKDDKLTEDEFTERWSYIIVGKPFDEFRKDLAKVVDSAIKAERGKIVKKLVLLLKANQEYIQLLSDKLDEILSFAAPHSWNTTHFEEGVEIRAKIEIAEKNYDESIKPEGK